MRRSRRRAEIQKRDTDLRAKIHPESRQEVCHTLDFVPCLWLSVSLVILDFNENERSKRYDVCMNDARDEKEKTKLHWIKRNKLSDAVKGTRSEEKQEGKEHFTQIKGRRVISERSSSSSGNITSIIRVKESKMLRVSLSLRLCLLWTVKNVMLVSLSHWRSYNRDMETTLLFCCPSRIKERSEGGNEMNLHALHESCCTTWLTYEETYGSKERTGRGKLDKRASRELCSTFFK